jgi:hypothetical protein
VSIRASASTASAARRTWGRRALGLLGALGLVLATVVALPASATAAPNPAIVVAGVVITSEDGGQATVGDTLTVSGAWDASAAEPEPGDSFTIGAARGAGLHRGGPVRSLGAGS